MVKKKGVSSPRSPIQGDFISCVPCLFCEKVSFDMTDTEAYSGHLVEDHNITKNVDKLLEMAKQVQTVKSVLDEELEISKEIKEDMSEKKPSYAQIMKKEYDGTKDNADGKTTKKQKEEQSKPDMNGSIAEIPTKTNDTKEAQKDKSFVEIPAPADISVTKEPQKEVQEKVKEDPKEIKTETDDGKLEVSEKNEDDKTKNCKNENKKQNTDQNKDVNKTDNKKSSKPPKPKKKPTKDELEIEELLESIEGKPGTKKKKGKEKKEIIEEVQPKQQIETSIKDKEEKSKPKKQDKVELVPTKEEGAKENKSKKKNGKEKSKSESLKGNLPEIGKAESGVVEAKAMKEVDDILDDWFKGGRDTLDEDVPDELPDIIEPKKKPKETKTTKKETIKPKKPEVKYTPKPIIDNDLIMPSEIDRIVQKQTITTDETASKSNLDELNDILDEWFSAGKDEDDNDYDCGDRFTEITDDVEEIDVKPDIKAEENEEKTDLDEVNDILDEWFANEGGEDDKEEGKEEETQEEVSTQDETPYKPVIVDDPIPKSEVPCGDCVVCGQIAKAFCTGCKHVFYCCRECQRKDWGSHKDVCKELSKLPYRVERSPVFGRFLAATKDLAEGELILQESPMVVGPRQLTKPVCLGCHKEIKSADEAIRCIRCNWPVCSRKCQDSPMHDPECRATKAAGSRVKVDVFNQTNMMYACITVLRALGLLDGPKKIWDDYMKFDSHLEKRIKTPMYSKVNKEKVVFFIHHYLGIKRYSDLEILEACGKLDTNCYEIRLNGLNLRAMYRTACLLSHDCTPNTRHTFSPDHSINLYTTRPIKKGEVITATYSTSLWPTHQRQEHLEISKCFRCYCLRCRDPTELGSYLSAIRCSRCKGFRDNVQMDDCQYLTPMNPLDNESAWRCCKCTNIQKSAQIKSGNESIKQELGRISKSDFEGLLTFLHKNEPILGTNNHHIVEAKYLIVNLLGNRQPYDLEDLSMEQLQIKERFCRELLNVADKIEPGSTRWRGQLMLELQMAIVALAAGKAEGGLISKSAAREAAEEGMRLLKTATAILQVEPDMIPILEGRMKSMSSLLSRWEE